MSARWMFGQEPEHSEAHAVARVMRLRQSRAWLFGIAVVVACPTVWAAPTLPLTRVRLYETGVGYFERSGAIPGGDTALPVPAGHLDALSQRGAQSRRDLGVVTSSGGKVTLGYVAEAPVWRSTYRIVLGQHRARLQGWALLHNDTDESWQSVQVELVNGRPSSFLYPLASPRYARRKLVTPQDQLYSVPQLFDTTVDNLWSGEEVGGGGYGEGIGLGSVGVTGHGAGGGGLGVGFNEESGELQIGNLAALTPAAGVEAAALFRYTLPS